MNNYDWLIDHDFQHSESQGTSLEEQPLLGSRDLNPNLKCCHFENDTVCGKPWHMHPDRIDPPRKNPWVEIQTKLGKLEVFGFDRNYFRVNLDDVNLLTLHRIRYRGCVWFRRGEDCVWTCTEATLYRPQREPEITWKQQAQLKEALLPIAVDFAGSAAGKKFLDDAELARADKERYEAECKIRELRKKIAEQEKILAQAKAYLKGVSGGV